jgi:hypothetical protein
MEDNKEIINSINWNNIVKLDARSIDRASLGQVQGLFEPCVIVEKGTLNKETYYIPKSVIEKYDHEALYFRLTEQEVKDSCLRDSPPSEEDAEQIRLTAEGIASTERPIISHSENQEEEILRKLMEAVSEFKDRVSSGAKWAKEKIEERQIQKDEQRISKMGELASTYTDSFDQAMSEIRTTHTYAEQEQIYDGFMKLLEKQREFVSARKDLASKLKSSITDPMPSDNVTNNTESLKPGQAQKQNLEVGRVISMGSTTQPSGFVLPSNEAGNVSPRSRTTADNNIMKVEQEKPFMVIEPSAIKYCKVSIKSSQKKINKNEKRKSRIPEMHLEATPYNDE